LEAVHVDVEPALGGRVGERDQLLDRARPDQGAVRLEHRPQREHPDVVQAERGDRVQIGPDLVEVEVQPVVEPAPGRGVIRAEAEGSGGLVHERSWSSGEFTGCA
jgi:hypothetical protein